MGVVSPHLLYLPATVAHETLGHAGNYDVIYQITKWAFENDMNQIFSDRFTTAGNNRALLISLLEEINQTSRSIKANLTRLSSEPRDGDPVGRDRQERIRRMKDKQGHLKTERELVKNKLATLKEYQKAMNHVENNHRTEAQVSYLAAFMASAIAILDEKQLGAIESMAANMIDSKEG